MLSLRFLSARDLPRPTAKEEDATWSIQVQGGSSRCIHLDRGTESKGSQVSSSLGNLPALQAWRCLCDIDTKQLLVWVKDCTTFCAQRRGGTVGHIVFHLVAQVRQVYGATCRRFVSVSAMSAAFSRNLSPKPSASSHSRLIPEKGNGIHT